MKVSEPKNVRPYDQCQSMLFPANLKDFIQDNDLCTVIDDVVNTLDLSCLYRNISSEGNMAYHPKMMLKVLFYAYACGIFSSRKIAQALGENVAFIFLAAWQRPDFEPSILSEKTILKRSATCFAKSCICASSSRWSNSAISASTVTKFKANAADRRSYDQKRIEKEIKCLLDKAEQIDREEDALYGPHNSADELPEQIRDRKKRLERLKQIQKELCARGKKKVNATDPDAAFMKTKAGIKTSYNVQACVDQDSQVIIAASVTNEPNDDEQLVPILDQAKENTNGSIDIVTADAGYGNASNLQALESYDIDAYIPDDTYQSRARGKPVGPFDKDHFLYDPSDDVFICPQGNVLSYWHSRHGKRGEYRIYRFTGCTSCPHFGRCTKSKAGRSIWRRQIDEKGKGDAQKLDSEAGRQIYAKRKHIIEPVFGQIRGHGIYRLSPSGSGKSRSGVHDRGHCP